MAAKALGIGVPLRHEVSHKARVVLAHGRDIAMDGHLRASFALGACCPAL